MAGTNDSPKSLGRILQLGWQIPVDLKADADFDESGSRPDHETFLQFLLNYVT
jgi:hypothetical protein